MKVEVLYVPGCPNHKLALERVQKVLATEGLVAELRETSVESEEQAARLNFPGSPTIRVDGEDVEASDANPAGLACRLYANHSGVPSEDAMRRALSRARQGRI